MNALAPPPLAGRQAHGAGRLLLDTAGRLARQPADWAVFLLHLSRLPHVRPYHRRVARALLQDVAQRLDGQVFAPSNGDFLLLYREPPASLRMLHGGLEPRHLPATLERLLQAEAPGPLRLTSAWRVDSEPDRLTAYATARLEDAPPPPEAPEPPGHPARVGVLAELASAPGALELMHRQSAVLLLPTRPRHGAAVDGGALRPLFTEIAFSLPAIQARAGGAGPEATDPYLARHLAGRLDAPLLEAMAQAVGQGSPLDPLRERQGLAPLHVNLGLGAILSDEFACLVAAVHAAGASLGVEVNATEAAGDPALFARARQILMRAGVGLAVDGVSHLTLLLCQPGQFGAELVKLDWSARIPVLDGRDAAELEAAIARLGPHRLVLHKADSESALRWGLSLGIRRFQGRHVDAMLAAARLLACPKSDACALRQCVERAAALSPGGRALCRNHPLLDAGCP